MTDLIVITQSAYQSNKHLIDLIDKDLEIMKSVLQLNALISLLFLSVSCIVFYIDNDNNNRVIVVIEIEKYLCLISIIL